MTTKIMIAFIAVLTLTSCKSPKDKITDVILNQDNAGYWNYEWPREGAEYLWLYF